MNQLASIELRCGGPGSGCTGPNCGRKSSSSKMYHATTMDRIPRILKKGLRTGEREQYPMSDKNVVYLVRSKKEAELYGALFSQYSGKFRGKEDNYSPIFDFSKKRDFAVVQVPVPEHKLSKDLAPIQRTGSETKHIGNIPVKNLEKVFYYRNGKFDRVESL